MAYLVLDFYSRFSYFSMPGKYYFSMAHITHCCMYYLLQIE